MRSPTRRVNRTGIVLRWKSAFSLLPNERRRDDKHTLVRSAFGSHQNGRIALTKRRSARSRPRDRTRLPTLPPATLGPQVPQGLLDRTPVLFPTIGRRSHCSQHALRRPRRWFRRRNMWMLCLQTKRRRWCLEQNRRAVWGDGSADAACWQEGDKDGEALHWASDAIRCSTKKRAARFQA